MCVRSISAPRVFGASASRKSTWTRKRNVPRDGGTFSSVFVKLGIV